MSFTDLPFCIRQDIIHTLVKDEPEFSSLSKEWLQCTASEFGRLGFYSSDELEIDASKSIKLSTPYVTRIHIARCENIDWDLIYSIKKFREVSVEFNDNESQDSCNETITKLMLPPSIEYIELILEVDVSKCLGQSLEKNQHCLKSLEIESYYVPYGFIVESLKLHNLEMLSIRGKSQWISTSVIEDNFPSLVSLDLDLNSFDSFIFGSVNMKNLTYLDLQSHCFFDKLFQVNLSSLPNLKNLRIDKGFEFKFELESTSFHYTRSFRLGGSLKSISKVLEKQFINLEILIIEYFYSNDEYDYILFEKCKLPNLKYLEIEWHEGNERCEKVSLIKHYYISYKNNTVEELDIPGYINDICQTLRHHFTTLKRVHLNINERTCDDNMNELFLTFKNLTKVSLSFHIHSDLLRALPSGPYSMTHLSFMGIFIVSSPLLTWFSHHLPHLTTLTLHWYHFRGEFPPSPLTFPNLRYLLIHTLSKHRTSVGAQFNSKNYPHIKLDIIKCKCYNCDMMTKFDKEFNKGQSNTTRS